MWNYWTFSCNQKQWRWSWTSGETPLLSPYLHHEQHCDCSGVIQVPWHHHLPGPEVGQSHWVHGEKGPAEAVPPSRAEEVKPATGAAETVLLCHNWIRPLHVNNCLVQLSYQIWPQKTTEGSPDCWVNHWYNPPHSPRPVLIQREQKDWQNHSGHHIQHTPSSICYRLVDATELWAPERPDTETVSSLRQSISWRLDNNYGTHYLYTYLTHTLSLHYNCT